MDKDTVTKAVDYTDPAVFKYFTRPQIDALDFTGFPEKYGYAKLDELIPKNPKYGKNDPPSQYLSSGKKVREWRSISGGNQKHILDNPRPAAVTRDTSRRAARREGRRRRRGHDSTDPAAQQLEQIESNLAASRKSNFGKRKTFYGFELDFGKIKRLRVDKSKGSKAIHR